MSFPLMYGLVVLFMANIDTGGGGAVGGGVEAGKDFTGRDKVNYNYYNDEKKHHLSSEERLSRLEIAMFGDERLGILGMIKQQKLNFKWLIVNTIVGVVTAIVLLAVALRLF